MGIFLIIVGVIGAIWLIGKFAQSTGIDKKMHDIEAQTRQMANDAKAAKNISVQTEDFVQATMQRVAAVAKERGISNAQAQEQLGNELNARKEQLIKQGFSADKAEDQAFKDVFQF